MDSHASLHQNRLDPRAAPRQQEVDRSVGEKNPLPTQTAALEQSDGRQRELLETKTAHL